MQLDITTVIGCKNWCNYCPQDTLFKAYAKKRGKKGDLHMSFDVFKKCIDKVPKECDIAFAGFSEPFLNADCTKMILYANEKGHQIFLFTTLVGLKLKDLEVILKKVPFRPMSDLAMGINVHLPSTGSAEKIKNFVDDEYIAVAKRLLKSKVKVDFHYHVDELDPRLKKILKKSDYHYSPLHDRAGNLNIKTDSHPKLSRKKGSIMCKYAFKKKGGYELNCHVLLPDGRVVLCCMDYSLQHVLGNLLVTNFESLHESENYKRIMRGLQNETLDILCRTCHNTVDLDSRAAFYNSQFSLNKLNLGSKILLYNKMNKLYYPLRSIRRLLIPGKNHKKGAEKTLKWD